MNSLLEAGFVRLLDTLDKACPKLGVSPYHLYCARTSLVKWYPLVSYEEVHRVLSSKRLFFVLNTGRSGSKFMAELLGRSDNAVVLHEPVPLEAAAALEAARGIEVAERYIRDFRQKQIYLLLRGRSEPIYGETSSTLIRHTDSIIQQWPSAKLMHLVRDPKKVITSVMNREALLENHPVLKPSIVLSAELTRREWEAMSRFEKACHMWQEQNAFIRKRAPHFVRFEDILEDYQYFKVNVLDYLGLHVPEVVWKSMVAKPINVSTKNRFPRFEEWSRAEIDAFERICGEEMSLYGYSLDKG